MAWTEVKFCSQALNLVVYMICIPLWPFVGAWEVLVDVLCSCSVSCYLPLLLDLLLMFNKHLLCLV
jgi:hypothetical protein